MQNVAIYLMRTVITASDKKRLKKDALYSDAKVFKDVDYFGDKKTSHLLDVIKPPIATKDYCIFVIHGGGFAAGSKEIYGNYCRRFANLGATVININYGLLPKNPFPIGLKDVIYAYNFMVDNAEQFQIDFKKVFMVGDSAGANLAASAINATLNKDLGDYLGVRLKTLPKGVALSSGMYGFDFLKGGRLEKIVDLKEMYFQKKEIDQPEKKLYEVIENVTKDFPPTLLISSHDDFLLKETQNMLKALTANDVTNQFLYYDESHGKLGHVFNCRYTDSVGNVIPEAEEAMQKTVEFFDKF